MKKRTKTRIKKTVLTVMLLLAVVIVQVAEGFALDAQAASEPSVVVNDFPGLYEAIIQARDGDTIGISDVISITANNVSVGDPEKHITIVRMNEVAFLDIASNQATIQNITFDGNGIAGMYPMCVANYHTDFLNDTFQNCINRTFDGNGGAVKGITGNISLNGCIFANNEAVNGGHAYIMNDTNLTIQNCTFTGGHASTDGGGLYIQTSRVSSISECTITGNTADRIGGGILNQSALTITDSRVYSNTAAIGGADIANRSGFNLMVEHDMDALAPLFADLNLNPVEWVNDFDNEAGVTIDGFEPTVENTFLKLSLEAISTDDPEEPGEDPVDPVDPGEGGNTGGESGGQEEPGTGEDTGGGTETPGDDSGSGQGGSDDSGQGDSTEGQGTDPGSTEGGNDSTTDPTEDPGNGSSDEGSDNTPSDSESGQGSSDAPGTGTEADGGSGQALDGSGNTTTDNSSATGDTTTDSNNSTNTTDSHDSSTHSDSHDSTTNNDNHSSDSSRTDNSRSSTTNDSHNSSVTNNYYTSENPSAPAPQTQQVASSQPPQVTVVNNIPSAEGQRSSVGQEQPQQQNQVLQSTDNIRIEANGVNVVYEVIDGVHSISINSTSQEASASVLQQLATESASAPEKQVVNWYEIAKVILLAGILVNLMWKRKEKD